MVSLLNWQAQQQGQGEEPCEKNVCRRLTSSALLKSRSSAHLTWALRSTFYLWPRGEPLLAYAPTSSRRSQLSMRLLRLGIGRDVRRLENQWHQRHLRIPPIPTAPLGSVRQNPCSFGVCCCQGFVGAMNGRVRRLLQGLERDSLLSGGYVSAWRACAVDDVSVEDLNRMEPPSEVGSGARLARVLFCHVSFINQRPFRVIVSELEPAGPRSDVQEALPIAASSTQSRRPQAKTSLFARVSDQVYQSSACLRCCCDESIHTRYARA